MKIAFIGYGNIASALVKGILISDDITLEDDIYIFHNKDKDVYKADKCVFKKSGENIKDNFDIIFVVKKCDIDFVKPGFFEDIINVETKILSFSKVKIIFKQNLLINKEIIVKAKITIVSINSSGKIKSMPNKLLNYFN